jgi:hypothetical protein
MVVKLARVRGFDLFSRSDSSVAGRCGGGSVSCAAQQTTTEENEHGSG